MGIDALVAEAIKGAPNFLFALLGMYMLYRENLALMARIEWLEQKLIACYEDADQTPK